MIHWPDKNRDKQTTALCGVVIPKVARGGYSWVHQDLSKVTATLDKVNCVECLRIRVKELNKTIDRTIDKIEELNGKTF